MDQGQSVGPDRVYREQTCAGHRHISGGRVNRTPSLSTTTQQLCQPCVALMCSQLLWRKQGNLPHYKFCCCRGCAAKGKSTFVFEPLDAQVPDFSDLQIIGELLMQISGILAMPHCHLPYETQSPESATTTLYIYQWWIYYYMHCPQFFTLWVRTAGEIASHSQFSPDAKEWFH